MNSGWVSAVDAPSPGEVIPGLQMPVRITVSKRRKKTVAGKIVDGVLDVRVPEGLPKAVRDAHIRDIAKRLYRKKASTELDLESRAVTLAKKYGLPTPTSIVWSARQNTRWGSCTPSTGSVRLSDRLAQMPQWVIDYVIVHELAHLVHLHHNDEFHALVARFPRAERAEGFLEAVSLGFATLDPVTDLPTTHPRTESTQEN